jgi:hypothetical protein
MEVNLYNHKQIVKSVREEVTLGEFYQILNTYKPTEFFNTMYSEKIPCWYITEYLNANTVMYYANGWADKTPQKITIEKLYQSWRIEGINYTKFYTDKKEQSEDDLYRQGKSEQNDKNSFYILIFALAILGLILLGYGYYEYYCIFHNLGK